MDFNTHPSVLRGNWPGTLATFSDNTNVPFQLINLVATCQNPSAENQCSGYTFQGQVQIGAGSPVSIEGYGNADNGRIYTQTSEGAVVLARFSFAGRDWELSSYYFVDNTPTESSGHYPSVLQSLSPDSLEAETYELDLRPSPVSTNLQ
ncbi:MAG: hypothetical protein ACRCYY_10890 [Trueperaceae bacterium]